jgi:cytochrome c oxidase assembly protein subunit 15
MSAPAIPFPDLDPARRRAVGRWLTVWAVMVLLTVVIGGVTRLTESGLSITEWAPVTGIVPPLSEADWNEAFARYQEIPEYEQLNRGMTLAEFKLIFVWEYVHRLWARLVGLALVLPLAVFLIRGGLGRPLVHRLLILLVLTGAQGALGWFMVQSGLSERTDVSQYRLAAHLALALIIYVITVWTTADLLLAGRGDVGLRAAFEEDVRQLTRFAWIIVALVFATAVAGAFVAGLEAGKTFNTFPLMGGRIVPRGYLAFSPWWDNLFENVATVQFNHRLLGVLTLVASGLMWWRGRWARIVGQSRRLLDLLATIAALQVALGVATLLLVVPVWLAALHQAGAVLLLTAALLLLHALRTPPVAGWETVQSGSRQPLTVT